MEKNMKSCETDNTNEDDIIGKDIQNDDNELDFDLDLETESIELDKLLSGDVKNINIQNKNEIKKNEYSIEDLNNMSNKQLKDIAEKYNLGVRGGKEQLLTKIKRNITMTS